MDKFSVLLIILAIIFILFANKIDKFINGDNRVKIVIIVFSVGVLLVSIIGLIACILA